VTAFGTSFTRWRAESLGLEYRSAFERVCEVGFGLVRLSASWREIAEFGWAHLDWLMARAEAARQPVLLTVGMKALGWPEFYLPAGLDPADDRVQRRALEHVGNTVSRYRENPTLLAWQIENEPFNRSGPQSRWIPRAMVRREAARVRSIDGRRPLVVTTFAHFSEDLDRASSHEQSTWKRRLGLDLPAEREALAVLARGDMLGTDVYRSIGWVDAAGVRRVAHAEEDQMQVIRRWQRIATEQGKRFWVTEAQAEPWEASSETRANPLSVSPQAIQPLMSDLAASNVELVLLWGCEYWLWRRQQGDTRWIDAVTSMLPAGAGTVTIT
jgi:hypothetical protein